jgi:hypothetical protein
VRGLRASHAIDHLLADFDRRRERLGITSKNVTKVN